MIRFDSDYMEGCIPEILTALQQTNSEQTPGYGLDPHCDNARALIKEACHNQDIDVHFLTGGTQTNLTVIASVLKPHQGVLCANSGHINVHETGAIEATGHRPLGLPSVDGTITASQVKEALENHYNDASYEHTIQPGMVYISFPTENGTLYSKAQLKEIYEVCQSYDIPLFVDGARMGYGLVSPDNDLTLEDFVNYTDIFYIGGTKVGALFGEAVVIANDKYKKDFRYHIKQRGGMLAKGRLLGIQFEELFKDNRYLEISKHAIHCAKRITDALEEKGYTFVYPPQTNQLFPILDNAKIEELRKDFSFLTWEKVDDDHTAVRLVTSFMTSEENVDLLISKL